VKTFAGEGHKQSGQHCDPSKILMTIVLAIRERIWGLRDSSGLLVFGDFCWVFGYSLIWIFDDFGWF
jgi:hypothetical protein